MTRFSHMEARKKCGGFVGAIRESPLHVRLGFIRLVEIAVFAQRKRGHARFFISATLLPDKHHARQIFEMSITRQQFGIEFTGRRIHYGIGSRQFVLAVQVGGM